MTKKPALVLLPNRLSKEIPAKDVLAPEVFEAVASIDGLIAEGAQNGRNYLLAFETKKRAHEMPIASLENKLTRSEIDFLLEPIIKNGERWGLVSDAGLPCIADPGHQIVRRAYQLNIPVEACSGPSSLMTSLMLSGLPGQHFTFNGYIPKAPEERAAAIKKIEAKSHQENSTQIFIEAPYRNMHTLEAMLETLDDKTLICVASDLYTAKQYVKTLSVYSWRKQEKPDINKKPATFLIYSPQAKK